MSSRKFDDTVEITAQPKQLAESLISAPIAEPGLSVDPEDLGKQFLSEATEQANFESSHGGDTSEVNITDPALTDGALTGGIWDSGGVWEHTINVALQSGGLDEARTDASPRDSELLQGQEPSSLNVDAVASNVRNASLMDQETDEPGGTASPAVNSREEDSKARHHDEVSRGGHKKSPPNKARRRDGQRRTPAV